MVQQTTDPIRRAGVWVGTGVNITGINRASDRMLGVRLVASAGAKTQAETTEQTLGVVQGYFDETSGTGLSEAYHVFFDSLASLTQDPSDISRRHEVVRTAHQLAGTVSRTAQGLEDGIASVDATLGDHVTEINNKLKEIASLNNAIGKSGFETGPGDLLDRRDQLIRDVAESAGATVNFEANGQATVFIGGHAVVSGRENRTLSIGTDSAGDTQVYVSSDSGKLRLTDSLGGQVGGLISSRSSMSGWLTQLDDFATTLASTVNAQHALGFDPSGNPGGDVFTVDPTAPSTSLSVASALAADPDLLATAGAATAEPGDDTNLRALMDLESAASYGGKTGADVLSSITTSVGNEVSTASADASSLTAQLDDLQAQRDSISKVDTDEEAIRLLEYQNAYRAAARVLAAGDQMLQTLLAI